MSDVDIFDQVPVDEAAGWTAAMMTTFLERSTGEAFDREVEDARRDWDPQRHWGARAGGRWVATLVTYARTMTVPGPAGATVDLAADAVTGVTVNATHRRRGLLREMLTRSLAAACERGDAISVLMPSEWPIYGRFGYAPATRNASYSYSPRRALSTVPPASSGTVRQVETDEFGRLAPAVFDAARRRNAGQIDRPGNWWARRLGLDGYHTREHGAATNYYVHEGADGPDGLLTWRPPSDFGPHVEAAAVRVGDLMAASDEAYRNLWALLSAIDLVKQIDLHMRPVDEPAKWLFGDGRSLRQTHTGDGVWLRLLDVPAALAARRYATTDRLVIEVVDDGTGGYGAGRFALEGGPDGASCAPSTESPDLTVSQRALASSYFGGYRLRERAIGGGIDEHTTGAIDRADAMFTTPSAPWIATGF